MPTIKDIKQSIIETTRALSGDPNLIVSFGEHANISKTEITLPKSENGDIKIAKGQADRLAFIYRYGDSAKIFNEFMHKGETSLKIIAMMETARTEGLGVKDFPGSLKHISPLHRLEESYFSDGSNSVFHAAYVASLLVKKRFVERLEPESEDLLNNLIAIIPEPLQAWAKNTNLDDENERKQSYTKLLELLELETDKQEEEAPNSQNTNDDIDKTSGMDGEENIIGASEKIKNAKGDDILSSDKSDKDGGYSFVDMDKMPAPFYYGENEDNLNYHAYTTTFDKEKTITTFVNEEEREHLKQKFSLLSTNYKGLARKLRVKLMRKLLSQRQLGWHFDSEEGVLDTSKLAQFIAGGSDYIFRLPRNKNVMDTAVTILVDNSGSMRGRPIEMAALTTDIITRTLERLGITTEVLGFTTGAWKGGESRLEWISAGRPDKPGRLNDLLHIIYKQGRIPYKKQKNNFAYMLADDILKENIDGESLNWAYRRLIKSQKKRKILLVISDGAPVDYATDRHNEPNYLDSHLKHTIKAIERQNTVELVAVGIGHDVGRYYKHAVTIENAETLGETLLYEFEKLFN